MTYVIIGLGNFGIALAERLTNLGHDVYGVDSNMNIVEEYKDTIATTICVNITDAASLRSLPIEDADEVIVAMGGNIGTSVLIVALLKQAGVKRLVARAVNKLHQTVLEALDVQEVIMPENMAANILALSSESTNIKSVYVLNDLYQIIEIEVSQDLISQNLQQVNLDKQFNLKLIAVKRPKIITNMLGGDTLTYDIVPLDDRFIFTFGDRLILYGSINNLQKLRKQHY